jgi:phosphate:Na+ symporter
MAPIFTSMDLWTGLFGGLALFLLGMDFLTRALKRVTGDQMKTMLIRLTGNRFKGVVLGAGVTAVVQSSSVTTVLIVGFISAGMMSFSQSIAVIMGADIGSTVTAQLLAFEPDAIALPLVAIGVVLQMAVQDRTWQEYGRVAIGIGLIFYGMKVMGDAMAPLKDDTAFLRFMVSLDAPWIAILAGTAFTALIQSSAATTGIMIVLANQGVVSLDAAIGVALGANIGTCVTALLAAIGKPREAVRAAVAHTLIKIVGVLAWVWFIPELGALAQMVSPTGGTGRALAWAHTIFNIANTVALIGFTGALARIVERMVPDRPERIEPEGQPRYLDKSLLDTPAIALDAAHLEVARLARHVTHMVEAVLPVAAEGPRIGLERLAERDRPIDQLHAALVDYLGKISLRRLSATQSDRLVRLISVANDVEQIADLVSRDVVTSAKKRLDDGVVISPATLRIIARFHGKVVEAMQGVVAAIEADDPERALQVRNMKAEVRALNREIAMHGVERLTAKEPRRVKTYAREVELIEILDDIFRLARRVARAVAEGAKDGEDPAADAPDATA